MNEGIMKSDANVVKGGSYVRDEMPTSYYCYYYTIPNMVDDLGLDVYSYRLYGHLKRVAGDSGLCWQTERTMAAACRMSRSKVNEAKHVLEQKGLITITPAPSGRGRPYHVIAIVDIWQQNYARYHEGA